MVIIRELVKYEIIHERGVEHTLSLPSILMSAIKLIVGLIIFR